MAKAKGTAANRARNRWQGLALIALGLCIGVIPISCERMYRARTDALLVASQSWVATPCRILEAWAHTREMSTPRGYNIVVRYEYEFRGHTYEGRRYDCSSHGWGAPMDNAALALRSDPSPHCFVDPAQPSESVLLRQANAPPPSWPVWVFLVAGVAVAVFGWSLAFGRLHRLARPA